MTDAAYNQSRTDKAFEVTGAAAASDDSQPLIMGGIMDESMNSEECAAFLHIHENTLMEKIATGEIPAAKIGKCWVFLKSDIVEYLRKKIRDSTAARRAEAAVETKLSESEKRNEPVIVPTLRSPRVSSKRKVPPPLPDLPSPEFVREFAAA